MNVLEVRNIIKRFGDYNANNDISFDVPQGKIFGLLGPNGAGKTTMIRMITNILMPDSGTIKLFDQQMNPELQNKIGYLPEERGLYKKVKVIEQLVYFGRLKGLSHSEANKRAKIWLAHLDISDWAGKKVQELSKGMQQKVQFISTILHDPDFIILDEPFSGFDPVNTELLKNIILELKEQGKTIILSTHVMHQVEQMCDEMLLINKGKVVLNGNVAEVKRGFGRNNAYIEFDGSSAILHKIPGVTVLNKTENTAEIALDSNLITAPKLIRELADKIDIYKFDTKEPSLHEIFIEVVSKKEVSHE